MAVNVWLKRALWGLAAMASLPLSLKGLVQYESTKTAADLCRWLNGDPNMPSYVTAGTDTRAVLNGLRGQGRPVTCVVDSTPLNGSAWTEASILLRSPIKTVGLRVAPLGRQADVRGYFTL